MKRLSIAFFTKTGQGPIRISCRCSMLLGTNLYFVKPRQQAQEELVPLTPLMMRTNGTDLVVREALEGELLLVLLGLEAIAPAWPGSEATRRFTSHSHKNIKHRVMKPMDPQNSMNVVL